MENKINTGLGIGSVLAMIIAYDIGANVLGIILAGVLGWIWIIFYIIFQLI